MKDRIKQYMDYKSISAGELATLLEVQRSNISHILNGRNKPGAAFIEKLLVSFPDLNARWLLTGEGEMTESKPQVIKTETQTTRQTIAQPEEVKENHTRTTKETSSTGSGSSTVREAKPVDKIVLLFADGTFIDYSKK